MLASLSSATRLTLLSLQDAGALQSTTQNRLATGKKVSSALDNPVSFFTAQGLDSRASDISNLLDGISNGVQAIQAATTGITHMSRLVDQARGLASQAAATKITTSGTASTDFSSAGTRSVTFYVNGTAVNRTIVATDTARSIAAGLNASIDAALGTTGTNYFSVDSSGRRLVLNASADVEFKASVDQTALGFAAGTGTQPAYSTTNTVVGRSPDLAVAGVKERAALATQYNDLLRQMTQLAGDASYNGVNLLNNSAASNKLHVQFDEKGASALDVQGVDLTAAGLQLVAISSDSASAPAGTTNTGNWLLDADIKTTASQLNAASSTLLTNGATFGSNLSIVQNRQNFSKVLINVLQTGSARLTHADLNEEAARSQALSTRQSLGISALALANTAQQQLLQLLR